MVPPAERAGDRDGVRNSGGEEPSSLVCMIVSFDFPYPRRRRGPPAGDTTPCGPRVRTPAASKMASLLSTARLASAGATASRNAPLNFPSPKTFALALANVAIVTRSSSVMLLSLIHI